MQTFLLVVGILAVAVVLLLMLAAAFVKKFAAKAGTFLFRQGVDALVEQARADYGAPMRDRLAALKSRTDALPEATIWNARSIIGNFKEIAEEMAAISAELDRLKAADAAAKADAIVIDGTATVVEQPLALPAPTDTAAATGTKSLDEILADFKAEWVTPGNRGVVDAWITGTGEDAFLHYQLDLAVADTAAETGKLPEVQNPYQGICTIITWFPREK